VWKVVPVSNAETEPAALRCGAAVDDGRSAEGPRVDVLEARDVPLGGPRALLVRRTLPQRARTLIGAWCFADHYGPVDGTHALVRPGEMNLMTGGYGIAHSEVSTPDTTVIHGVQLWVALPEEHRNAARDFQHHVPEPVRVDGAEIKVFLGSLAGSASPVRTFTPLLGAEIVLAPGATVMLAVDTAFEHGLLVDSGKVRLIDTGRTRLRALRHRRRDGGERLGRSRTNDPARRPSLRGGDRHVVELHRSQPGGHREGPGGMAGGLRPLR
jgi:redox-sensitive bicupin YhaK (pirin superfamily)